LYVVTSSDSTTKPAAYDTSMVGTLRGAVEWADANVNLLVLNATPNLVVFDTAGTFATPQTITLGIGPLAVANPSAPLMITGPGATRAGALTVSGSALPVNPNYAKTVFLTGSICSISGMTISRAEVALRNGGHLALDNVVVSDNVGDGAAILNFWSLTITN